MENGSDRFLGNPKTQQEKDASTDQQQTLKRKERSSGRVGERGYGLLKRILYKGKGI